MTRLPLWTLVLCCLVTAVFSGCRSITPAVTYYTLSAAEAPPAAVLTDDAVELTIGIHPVMLPGIVNRISMVRRADSHELDVSSLNRWADYPDRLVQQVLGSNLTLFMPRARVVNSPWPVGINPDILLENCTRLTLRK